jgi:hypothetical protein
MPIAQRHVAHIAVWSAFLPASLEQQKKQKDSFLEGVVLPCDPSRTNLIVHDAGPQRYILLWNGN